MQIGTTGIELPTFWLEDDRSTPQSQPPIVSVWLNFQCFHESAGLMLLCFRDQAEGRSPLCGYMAMLMTHHAEEEG